MALSDFEHIILEQIKDLRLELRGMHSCIKSDITKLSDGVSELKVTCARMDERMNHLEDAEEEEDDEDDEPKPRGRKSPLFGITITGASVVGGGLAIWGIISKLFE